YAMLSVAALYLAERYEKESRGWLSGAVVGVVIGLAFLSRSSGLALLAAVAAYFVARRQWRRALLPVAVARLFVIGWVAWGYSHRTTFEGGNAAYYTSYLNDISAILSNLQAQNNTSKLLALLSIIGQNLLGAIVISIPVVCLGLNYESISNLS